MISDDERAFLRQIAERPGDDSPRLIFADWLDDRGDPRGSMIRLQLVASHLPPEHPDSIAVEAAIRNGLPTVERLWQGHLEGLVSGWSLRGGLPECVTLSARDLARSGPKLFDAVPVQRVRLESPLTHFPQLCVLPIFQRIRELDLCGTGISLPDLQSLSRVAHLKRLRCLNLSFNGLTNDSLEIVSRLTALASTVELSLNDNEEIGSSGIRCLVHSQTLVSLRRLDLAGNRLADSAVESILSGPAMANLDSLHLEGNPIGDAGIALLADSPLLTRMLERSPILSLDETGLSERGLRSLIRAPAFGLVEILNLSRNAIGDDGIRSLIASERLKKLRVLRLRKTGITAEAVVAIADSPWLSTLESVDLRDNYLTFRSVEYLRGRSARTDWRSPIEVLTGDPFSRESGPIEVESTDR